MYTNSEDLKFKYFRQKFIYISSFTIQNKSASSTNIPFPLRSHSICKWCRTQVTINFNISGNIGYCLYLTLFL